MTPWLVNKVREQLMDKGSLASEVALHDWLTYAICRSYGHKWIVDNASSVMYRQHQVNVVGANVGISAKWKRLQKLNDNWYRLEVLKIAKIARSISSHTDVNHLINLLESKNIFTQLKLLTYISESRRKFIDRLLLACAMLIGLF